MDGRVRLEFRGSFLPERVSSPRNSNLTLYQVKEGR